VRSHSIASAALFATLAFVPDAGAQATDSAAGAPATALRSVPRLSVSIGTGVVSISGADTTSAPMALGVSLRLHRYFGVEGEAGHYTGQTIALYTWDSPAFGGGTQVMTGSNSYSDTWDVWYGSVAFVSRVDLGRARLWGGAGFTSGTDQGRTEQTITSCRAADALNCPVALNLTYAHQPPTSVLYTAGVEVPIGRRVSAFGQAHFDAYARHYQGGVRVALRSVDEVTPTRLSVIPRRPAAAGQPPGEELRLTRGMPLWVTTVDGVERSGELLALSADEVSLRTPTGTIAVPFARVQRIDKQDSIKNGLLSGALIGAGGMFVTALAAGFFGGADESPDAAGGLALSAMGAGIGALAGAGIDTLIKGRKTVFIAAGPRAVSVAPIARTHGAGIGVSLRW
jgi:hypothetical protein